MDTASQGGIEVERRTRPEGVVVTLAIENRAKANALGAAMLDGLADALSALQAQDELRAVVLTGGGERAFVGGADIREMARIADGGEARVFIGKVHAACAAVRACPVPVIARIQGACLGAGLELAAACDIRIAAERAVLGMPEVRLGIPSVVEAALLPGLIGWGRARRLLLTGENISARTALAWGLVDEVATDARLDAAVEEALAAILACGPLAVRSQKALIGEWERLALDQAIEAGASAFEAVWSTDEPRRRLSDYLSGRARPSGVSR